MQGGEVLSEFLGYGFCFGTFECLNVGVDSAVVDDESGARCEMRTVSREL